MISVIASVGVPTTKVPIVDPDHGLKSVNSSTHRTAGYIAMGQIKITCKNLHIVGEGQ